MADGKIGEAVAEQAAGGRGAFDPDRVQMIDIDTLVLDPANVRTHPQRNIDAIVGSLQAFGQQKPVVVDADNVVRAGNGLVRAARLLGWSQVAAYTTGLGGSEAIAYAIDKKFITKALMGGFATPADGPIVPSSRSTTRR